MKFARITDSVRKMAAPVAMEANLDLVDVEYQKEGRDYLLRITIDKPGGITHEDCAYISERVGRTLDEADIISEQYRLEVSSPGLDRPLKTEQDFFRFIGEVIEVHTYAPVEGKRLLVGKLSGYRNGLVTIETEEGNAVDIAGDTIAKACLHIRI